MAKNQKLPPHVQVTHDVSIFINYSCKKHLDGEFKAMGLKSSPPSPCPVAAFPMYHFYSELGTDLLQIQRGEVLNKLIPDLYCCAFCFNCSK